MFIILNSYFYNVPYNFYILRKAMNDSISIDYDYYEYYYYYLSYSIHIVNGRSF